MSLLKRRQVRSNEETLAKLKERRDELSRASAEFQTAVMTGTYKRKSRVRVISSEEKDEALA